MSQKQVRTRRQVKVYLDTSFMADNDDGLAFEYLKKLDEIPFREGVAMSVACLYAPLAAAAQDASLEEVIARCEKSKTILDNLLNRAISRTKVENSTVNQPEHQQNLEDRYFKPETVSISEEEEEDDDYLIDLNNEKF